VRNNIKVLIVTFLIIIIGLSFSGCTKNQYSKKPALLPALKLPSYGGFIPHDFDVQLKADVSNTPHEMLVYKIDPIKINEEETKKLCTIFGVDINAVSKEDQQTVIKKQGNGELWIFKKTGFYNFSTKDLDNYFPQKQVPGDEECLTLAKSFVKKYELLPDLYQYRTSIDCTTYHPSFNEDIIIDKTVTFHPIIDGKEVIGPKFGVAIGDKGKIEGVTSTLYNIIPVGIYPLKSIDEIVNELKQGKAVHWWTELDNPDADKLIIEKVAFEYYGDIGTVFDLGQLFVQPIYKLQGEIIYKNGEKGRFTVALPAIDNQFIIP